MRAACTRGLAPSDAPVWEGICGGAVSCIWGVRRAWSIFVAVGTAGVIPIGHIQDGKAFPGPTRQSAGDLAPITAQNRDKREPL